MSRTNRNNSAIKRQEHVHVFFALGDKTRLSLVAKLSGGPSRSISQLTKGSRLTRQAITKHLRIVGGVGIVHGIQSGRENLFKFDPRPIEKIKKYLDLVSEQWEQAGSSKGPTVSLIGRWRTMKRHGVIC